MVQFFIDKNKLQNLIEELNAPDQNIEDKKITINDESIDKVQDSLSIKNKEGKYGN